MELDIHAGKRILYKQNGQWEVGELTEAHNTYLNDKGLFFSIKPIKNKSTPPLIQHDIEINDIFLDSHPVEDYWREYKDIFMTKEEYIDFIEGEDFIKSIENAFVSDGEYYYYPVSKYTKNWIEKQPFDYIVRSM